MAKTENRFSKRHLTNFSLEFVICERAYNKPFKQ